MKKLRITTGAIEVEGSTEKQLKIKSVDEKRTIAYIPSLNPDAEGNVELFVDALNVANKYDYTPSMLMEENKVLQDNAKDTFEAMQEVLQSDLALSEIVSQRKVFLFHLKEARARLIVNNSDGLDGVYNENCADSSFIILLDTLINP
jgi:hypothetical protein